MNSISRGPTAGLIFFAIVVLVGALWLRSPGLDIRDGHNDRGGNGIVLGPSWTGGDATQSALVVGEIARSIREHHLAELYLQLPPPNSNGALTGIDSARIEALLYECYDARGWAQVNVAGHPFDDPRWRRFFIVDLRRLLDRVPRLRGVQLDFSGIDDVSPALLMLLDELRPALAADARLLSIAVAAWKEPYFREVARRADQLVAPLDVHASGFAKFSVARNVTFISNALAWSEAKPVLFRIPPAKQLPRALRVVHLGLSRQPPPDHYRGIILDSGTAPDAGAWMELRGHFLRP